MIKLAVAVEMFEECQYREMSCEEECPLRRPVHEWSEHPTLCEDIAGLDNALQDVPLLLGEMIGA